MGLYLSLIISLLSVVLLFVSWNRTKSRFISTFGWFFFAVSIFIWAKILGSEIGTVYALNFLSVFAWVVTYLKTLNDNNWQISAISGTPVNINLPSVSAAISHQTLINNFVLFILAVPLAGVASILFSLAAVSLFPLTIVAKIGISIFIFPIIWGGLSFWVCAKTKMPLAYSLVTSIVLISSTILFL
ncbi:MAG: hypothetical protein KUG78_06875 [Kangiellaceae bacterium]|nr:hypothetical protein [Kangiellaceae bacterium]